MNRAARPRAGSRGVPVYPRARAWVGLLGLWVAAPTWVAGQASPRSGEIHGVVVDQLSEAPLANTLVRVEGLRVAVLTDESGAFALRGLPMGEHVILLRQYGFEEVGFFTTVAEGSTDFLRIELPPMPVMLDGVEVVADRLTTMQRRLESRRNSTPYQSRAFDQMRLVTSASADVLEFLGVEGSLQAVGCRGGVVGSTCVLRRGRVTSPRVYIDEVLLLGGMDFLSSYSPTDFYLIETYSAGLEIRLYSHQFMDRMARRTMALFPIGLGG